MINKTLNILLVIVLGLSSCQNEITIPSLELDDAVLKVKASDGLTAGNNIVFYIATKEKAKADLLLVINNGLTIQTFDCNNNKPVTLPAQTFIHSGLYTIKVIYNSQIIVSKKLRIEADEIINPLELHTGPKTILVGAKQPSMVTTIPADQYDNGITNNDSIHFESDKRKGIYSNKPITNLFSSLEFRSGNQAKKVLIGVSKDKISSTEQTVQEVPDWGSNFKIEIIEQYPYADNRQYTKLRSSRIYDQYGNQIADGTLANFEIYNPDKIVGLYKAIVVDGVANIFIKNPSLPTKWIVRSRIGPYCHSNELKLEYQNNLKELQWTYDDFRKTIEVGPLKSVLGQYVPDGTVVNLKSKGVIYRQETYDGYTTFELAEIGVTHREKVFLNCSDLEEEIQL